MIQEDSFNNDLFEDFFAAEKLGTAFIKEINHNFDNTDFLDINQYFSIFESPQKNDQDSTFHTKYPELTTSPQIENQSDPIVKKQITIPDDEQEKYTSDRICQRRKKPDYKKNICGYITKTVLKQAISKQFKSVIESLCVKYQISIEIFYQIYNRSHENITGPTHLYGLLTPRLEIIPPSEWRQEINIRIVFLVFYKWFIRHRYPRYIMIEGKMEKKDQYINYKNKELLYLITEEWKTLLCDLKKYFKENKNQIKDGKITDQYIRAKYDQLIEQHSINFDQDEYKEFVNQMMDEKNQQLREIRVEKMTNQEQIEIKQNQEIFHESIEQFLWCRK